MFLTIGGITYRHIENWGQKVFGEAERQNNPFAFNNYMLWEKAIHYLQLYIDQEIQDILQGKQVLVYTNRKHVPFKRKDEMREQILERILVSLEKELGQKLVPMDRAYIACKFYNDVEQAILEEATTKGIFETINDSFVIQHFFLKKLRYLLKEGQEVDITTLKNMYKVYICRGLWKYY